MTEDDARQKWCPYARVEIHKLGWPTQAEAFSQTRCIASDCMMWRWSNLDGNGPRAARPGRCGLTGP